MNNPKANAPQPMDGTPARRPWRLPSSSQVDAYLACADRSMRWPGHRVRATARDYIDFFYDVEPDDDDVERLAQEWEDLSMIAYPAERLHRALLALGFIVLSANDRALVLPTDRLTNNVRRRVRAVRFTLGTEARLALTAQDQPDK